MGIFGGGFRFDGAKRILIVRNDRIGDVVLTLGAGDVWKEKKPADWPQKDLQKFLTKSAWSKTVPMQMDPSRMNGGRGSRGMGGGRAFGGGSLRCEQGRRRPGLSERPRGVRPMFGRDQG